MSDDRRALLERFIEAWGRRDAAGALALMSEDCEFRTSIGPDPGTCYRGRADVERAFRAFLDVEPDPATTPGPVQVLVAADFAVTRWSATTRSGAGEVTVQACDVFTFRDGAIASKDTYRKVDGAPPC